MRIAVFLSHGVSLATWDWQGILDREVAIYRALARDHEVALVVPDRTGDVPGLRVLPNRWGLSPWLYAFCAPLIHWRYLRTCHVLRGHNGRALVTPMLAKWLSRRAALVVRCGYLWSYDAVKRGVPSWKLWGILILEWLAMRTADTVIVATDRQRQYLTVVHGIS